MNTRARSSRLSTNNRIRLGRNPAGNSFQLTLRFFAGHQILHHAKRARHIAFSPWEPRGVLLECGLRRRTFPAIGYGFWRRLIDKVHTVVINNFCPRSEEHTSELQSPCNLVCRLLLEKKK